MVFDSPGMLGALIGVFCLDTASAMQETTLRTIEMLKLILSQSSNLSLNQTSQMAAARSGITALVNELSKDIFVNGLSPEQKTRYTRAGMMSGSVGLMADQIRNSTTGSQFMQPQGFQQPGTRDSLSGRSDSREQVVVNPQYRNETVGKQTFERIITPPNVDRYVELCMNKAGKKNKYYRLKIGTELEKSEFVSSSVFASTALTRGKQLRTEKSVWQKLFSRNQEYMNVGYFKGNISVYKQRTLDGLMNLGIPTILESFNLPVSNLDGGGLSKIDQDIVKERDVRVRVYLVDAHVNDSYDMGSEPDIYTKFYLGDKLLDGSNKSRVDDKKDPRFYSLTEFKTKLPGPSLLKIVFMDYDPIGSDDFIGATEIDLESRFFDPLWRAQVEHPVENRTINVNSIGGSVGQVRLWVEIDPMDDAARLARPAQEIAPLEPMNFEFRVVVWEANDVPENDTVGLSDVYVMGTFDSLGLSGVTDTHWRCQGFVSFCNQRHPSTGDYFSKSRPISTLISISLVSLCRLRTRMWSPVMIT